MTLDDILVPGSARYCRFSNAEGKTWVMPCRDMRVGMALYQPGSGSGKLVKRWLPRLWRVPGVLGFLNASLLSADLRPDIKEKIAKAFDTADFEWSAFGGTPSAHQKITLQIFRGERLLGYVKLTDSPEVGKLFLHEAEALKSIESLNVPRVLLAEETIFIQDTRKTLDSVELHDWTPLHEAFLAQLREATARRLPFEQTDYCRVLTEAEPYMGTLPAHVAEARAEALRGYAGKMVEFSACHCDFTPWNMVADASETELYVFDWEYAAMTYPPGLDRWHYQLQSAFFEKRLPPEQLLAMLKAHPDKATLRLYLLDVICRFAVRERGVYHGDMARLMGVWTKLLTICEP